MAFRAFKRKELGASGIQANLIEFKGKADCTGISKVRGQLFPLDLDSKSARNIQTQFGLLTDSGEVFYIKADDKWRLPLWQHLWEFVVILGTIERSEKTISIASFYLDGSVEEDSADDLKADHEERLFDFDWNDVLEVKKFVQHGLALLRVA